MHDVTGAGVAELAPATPSALVDSLNAAARRHRMWPWVLVVGLLLTAAVSPFFLVAAVPAVILAAWRDTVRRTVVTFYEVNDAQSARFAQLVEDFAVITASEKGWHTVARGDLDTTYQRKINAGAARCTLRPARTGSSSPTGYRRTQLSSAPPGNSSTRTADRQAVQEQPATSRDAVRQGRALHGDGYEHGPILLELRGGSDSRRLHQPHDHTGHNPPARACLRIATRSR